MVEANKFLDGENEGEVDGVDGGDEGDGGDVGERDGDHEGDGDECEVDAW